MEIKEMKMKFQKASDRMLESLQKDKLDDSEKYEWYGYLRAIRDMAFENCLIKDTTIQDNLDKGFEIIRKLSTPK